MELDIVWGDFFEWNGGSLLVYPTPKYVVIVFDVGINLEPIFPLPPSLTRRGILFFNPSKMGWGLKIKISFRIEYTYVEKVDLEYFSAGIG